MARVTSESERLEHFWSGAFGDEYTQRNLESIDRRQFWRSLHEAHPFASALEVGCNAGENLTTLREVAGVERLAGVDVNERALELARTALGAADLRHVAARRLPFDDASYELVFTAMVLIHQPDETVADVMAEVVRCSSRYVLAVEYEAPEQVDVVYRGHEGTLFKRPYARLYAEAFPQLRLVDSGFMGDEGWDDVTWSLFDQQSA